MEVFVDSDVVISSLLSSTGASYQLLHSKNITPIISTLSKQEIEKVITRRVMALDSFDLLIKGNITVIKLDEQIGRIKKIYGSYVLDKDDAHIVAGAKEAKVRFLITYNLKDFKMDKIKQDFDILVITPGMFLQYLRSV